MKLVKLNCLLICYSTLLKLIYMYENIHKSSQKTFPIHFTLQRTMNLIKLLSLNSLKPINLQAT